MMIALSNQGPASNSSTTPTLTIILPTRNANQLLEYSIISVLQSKDQRFELVVVDNNFPSSIKLNQEIMNDPRLTIIYSNRKLSMSENWHLGLSSARGDWITYMGSDDGIVTHNISNAIDIIENVHRFDEAVLFRSIGFTYPINERPAWFELPEKITRKKISMIINTGIICAFFPTQMISTLPIPYGGAICRKKLLSEILNSDLRIPGIAPDYFLGFYVGLRAKKILFADEIFAIRGVSEISNGYQTLNDIRTPNMVDFLTDTEEVNSGKFKQSDIKCRTRMSMLDFLLARKNPRSNGLNLSDSLLLSITRVKCIEEGHHRNFLLVWSLPVRRFLFNNIGYLIRKLWFFDIGVKTKSLRNRKVYLEKNENISSIQSKIQFSYKIHYRDNTLGR